MSYDKYERGRPHLNGGQQEITYKKKKERKKLIIIIIIKKQIKKKIISTLRLTQSNQWMSGGRGETMHAAPIHSLNFPPMTGTVEKNKMIVMLTMMI